MIDPSLIDKPFTPCEEKVPSWGYVGVVFFLFVGSGLILDWMRFYYD